MTDGTRVLVAAVLALSAGGCRSRSGDAGGPGPAPSPSSASRPTAAPASAAPEVGSRRGPALWSRSFPGAKILAVATARGDDVIVVGAVSGTVDLGGGPLEGRGVNNAVVARFDAAGKHLWSKRFPGEGSQVAVAVAVDAADDILITGTLDRAADFGGGVLESAGMIDVFVVKLGPSGKHVWSRRFGDASEQEAGGIAVGPDGAVVLVGSFEGTIDFGGGRLTSAGGDDVFVAKLDAAGKHLWSKRSGDVHAQHGRAVAVDPAGNVVLAGDAQGAVDFGGSAPASPDATSLFLARFDPRGRVLAGRRFAAEPRALVRPHALAIGGEGALGVAGALRGVTDLGGGRLQSASDGEPDAFVLALDASLAPVWSKRFGDAASQEALAIALDPTGGAVLAGRFEGSVDFGGGTLVSAGKDDVFVARFSRAGAHLASARFGDRDRQEAVGLALDRTSSVALIGSVRGTTDFGAGPLSGPAGFLLKLGHP